MGDDRISKQPGSAEGASTGDPVNERLSRDERAELELLRDLKARVIGFGGDDYALMPWVDAHRHHAKVPYIGCPFCRGEFVLRPARWITVEGHAARNPGARVEAIAGFELARLRASAEGVVVALLPLLPLEGSANTGYRVTERIDPTVRALPEEWGDAAFAVSELYAEVHGRRSDG